MPRPPLQVFDLAGSLTLFLLFSFCVDRLFGFSIYLFIILYFFFPFVCLHKNVEKKVALGSSLMQSTVWQNQNWWVYWSHSYHAPNPKRSKAWERRLKVPVDFSFLTIQSTKIISSTNIKNYHNNSIEYTLKVRQSSKQKLQGPLAINE